MPFQSMSLEEFARHVGMDAREVQRMADRAQLPGHKIGGQWRFNRARMTEWLQQHMHTFDAARLSSIEQSMGAAASDYIVTGLIGVEGIDPNLPAKTRTSVLRELVRLAERTGLVYDAAGLIVALEQREELCSTALLHGVAIPHPRQPQPYATAEPLICVGLVPKGIGFGSMTRELTRLFFLICCHDDRHHLRVLARLMRILTPEVIGELMACETREDLLALLIDAEKVVLAG